MKIPSAQPPRVEVRALRKICEGEELFVEYGKGYWMKSKGKRVGVKEVRGGDERGGSEEQSEATYLE